MRLIVLAVAALLLPSLVQAQSNRRSGLTVTPTSATIQVGQTLQLVASQSGAKWTISDPLVATLTTTGQVTGRSPGKTIITARVKNLSAMSTVTVIDAPPPPPPPPLTCAAESLTAPHAGVSFAFCSTILDGSGTVNLPTEFVVLIDQQVAFRGPLTALGGPDVAGRYVFEVTGPFTVSIGTHELRIQAHYVRTVNGQLVHEWGDTGPLTWQAQ